MKCCVCDREREAKDLETLTLTEEEKSFVRRMGKVAPESYTYCKPCLAVLRDREQGARLMQGVTQINLASKGVAGADQQAQKVYDLLIRKSAPAKKT